MPLLEREFVPTISEEAFLAGYGATQAIPGPLFTVAAYIGTIIAGWQGGLLATIAIFLPAFLLIFGALAFYNPIWTSAVLTPLDFAFAAILFSMLTFFKLPPWVIVLVGGIGGMFLL